MQSSSQNAEVALTSLPREAINGDTCAHLMPAVTIRVLAVLAVGLGLWLLDDAMTFALYAPTPTRSRGCYTAIEQWLGVTHPRDAIRQAELWTGLGLAAGMPIVLAVRWMRRAW